VAGLLADALARYAGQPVRARSAERTADEATAGSFAAAAR
jgi:hypothetical protein